MSGVALCAHSAATAWGFHSRVFAVRVRSVHVVPQRGPGLALYAKSWDLLTDCTYALTCCLRARVKLGTICCSEKDVHRVFAARAWGVSLAGLPAHATRAELAFLVIS